MIWFSNRGHLESIFKEKVHIRNNLVKTSLSIARIPCRLIYMYVDNM